MSAPISHLRPEQAIAMQVAAADVLKTLEKQADALELLDQALQGNHDGRWTHAIRALVEYVERLRASAYYYGRKAALEPDDDIPF